MILQFIIISYMCCVDGFTTHESVSGLERMINIGDVKLGVQGSNHSRNATVTVMGCQGNHWLRFYHPLIFNVCWT